MFGRRAAAVTLCQAVIKITLANMDVVYYEDATMEDAMEFLGAEKEEERGAVQ